MSFINKDFINNTWEKFLKFQDGKRLILFGADKFAENFIIDYLDTEAIKPCFIIDNDFNKWYRYLFDYEIFEPKKLLSEKKDSSVVLITSETVYPLKRQLEEMNVYNYFSAALFLELQIGKKNITLV